MAGAGKTTLGKALAQKLNWLHVDTDYLLEAWWGTELETLRKTLGANDFLRAEQEIILQLKVKKTVISTGGSVVYSEQAMNYLRQLGKIIYLQASQETLEQRIKQNPKRGLIIQPGQTIADLVAERTPLYQKYAQFSIHTESNLDQNLEQILTWLKKINFTQEL